MSDTAMHAYITSRYSICIALVRQANNIIMFQGEYAVTTEHQRPPLHPEQPKRLAEVGAARRWLWL